MIEIILFFLLSLVSSHLLTVKVFYPESVLFGRKLFLRGDNCGLLWTKGKEIFKINKDSYKIDLNFTEEIKKVEMKVLVDDSTWMLGHNEIVSFSSYPKKTSTFTIEIYPFFWSYKGNTFRIPNVYSPQLGNSRYLDIYLPPSYNENYLKIHHRIIIMHDGQNLFDQSTCFSTPWYVQNIIDGLVISGDISEILVVGVDNTDDRENEYTYCYDPLIKIGGKADLYLDFIENEVMKLVKNKLRIEFRRESLGMAGSSHGGLVSCYGGYTRSNIYSKLICMSSSMWWNYEGFNKTIMASSKPQPIQPISFYLDCGTDEKDFDFYYTSQTVYNHFLSLPNFKKDQNAFWFSDQGGQHNEKSWSNRFWRPLKQIWGIESHNL